MRLVRIGERGDERPGPLVGGDLFVDWSDVVTDCNGPFFGSGRIASLPMALRASRLGQQTQRVSHSGAEQ